MKPLGIIFLLTLLENSFTFPKPDKKKKDNWKEIAKDALCDSRDSAGVMEALKDYDDKSLWFVLVSSGKKGDTLKRPRRDSDKGKGWAADYKEGKLYDTKKCDLTMVVWRGKDLKIGDSGKCETEKTSAVMQEVISRGKDKKEKYDDVRKRLKKKSKKEGIKHAFFILWSSGNWKWSHHGIEENKCLVQTPDGFFLINPGGKEDSSSSSEEDSDEDSSEEDSDEDSSSSSEEDSDEDSSSSCKENSAPPSGYLPPPPCSSSKEDSDEDSSSSEEDSDEDSSSNEEDSEEDSSSNEEDSEEDSSSSSDEDSSSEEDSDEDSSSSSKEDPQATSGYLLPPGGAAAPLSIFDNPPPPQRTKGKFRAPSQKSSSRSKSIRRPSGRRQRQFDKTPAVALATRTPDAALVSGNNWDIFFNRGLIVKKG